MDTAYVSFGPREGQEMPLEWAAAMLTLWKERQPAQFGAYLAEVVTGAKPKASRS
jgi:hypothetical protein